MLDLTQLQEKLDSVQKELEELKLANDNQVKELNSQLESNKKVKQLNSQLKEKEELQKQLEAEVTKKKNKYRNNYKL